MWTPFNRTYVCARIGCCCGVWRPSGKGVDWYTSSLAFSDSTRKVVSCGRLDSKSVVKL